MAEQSTAQQDSIVVENILDNAGVIASFRTASLADEKIMMHVLKGSIEPGELANLSAYTFYMKVSAGVAWEPFSGETPLPENEGSLEIAQQVIVASQVNYASFYEDMPIVIRPKRKPNSLNQLSQRDFFTRNSIRTPQSKRQKKRKGR